MAELAQATGALSRLIYCKEASWGTSPTTGYRELCVVGGESLNNNISTYRSNIIRSDRMRHRTVRGTRRPEGSIPFELHARNLGFLFWHALGDDVTTTALSGADEGKFSHVIKATKLLPQGFTIEKGFQDATTPLYEAYDGCRVNGFSLNFGVDAMVSGSMALIARKVTTGSTTVAGVSSVTAQPEVFPITSVQAVLKKDNVEVAACENLTIDFGNNLYGDNGFTLGTPYRRNLKAGARDVGGSAQFLFENWDFYNLAVNGTTVDMQIICTDDNGHSITFDMDEVQLLPNDISPKIQGDGPLSISAGWESLKDPTSGTNLIMTIVNDEEDIKV